MRRKFREYVADVMGLFAGNNTGKQLVKVSDVE